VAVDQVELPPALPPLERLFAGDRVVDAVEHFDVDEAGEAVFPAEAEPRPAVLVDAGKKAGGKCRCRAFRSARVGLYA
jgi:hypothetical protein